MSKQEKERIYQKQDEQKHLELLWRLRDEDSWKENMAPAIQRKIQNGQQLSQSDRTNIYLYGEPGINRAAENKTAPPGSNLRISQPHDEEEKQADTIARKIANDESAVLSPASQKQMQFPQVDRKEEADLFEAENPWAKNIRRAELTENSIRRKEDDQLMRKTGEGELQGTDQLKSQLDSSKGSGQPLAENLRSEMETKMGADLSGVSIHNNATSDELAKGVNAKAFTYGQDIYFKQGQFNPASKEGKELLAHEVVHTRQQKSGGIFAKLFRKKNPQVTAMEAELDPKIKEQQDIMDANDKDSQAYKDAKTKRDAYEAMEKEMKKLMNKDENFTWNPENYRTYLESSKYHTGDKFSADVTSAERTSTAGSDIEKEERLDRYDTKTITKADLDLPTKEKFTQTTFVATPVKTPDGETPREKLKKETSAGLITYSNIETDTGVQDAIKDILATLSGTWTLDQCLEYAGSYKYEPGKTIISDRLVVLMSSMSTQQIFDIRYKNQLIQATNTGQIVIIESAMNAVFNTQNEFVLYDYMQKTQSPEEKLYLSSYFHLRFPGDAYNTFIAKAENKFQGQTGKDYTEGEIIVEGPVYAYTDATQTKKLEHESYFKKGDKVTLLSSSGNYVFVEGTGTYKDGEEEKQATIKGWIPRSSTNMTLGDFYGLDIEDMTGEYGGLSTGERMQKVNGIILHQTGASTTSSILRTYRGRIKAGGTIGAQYLISPNGEIKLIVPIDKVVSHAPLDPSKEPLIRLTKANSVADIPVIKQEIQKMYNGKEIPFAVYNRLYNMKNADLYKYLVNVNIHNQSDHWYIYPVEDLGNLHTIGIEVTGAPRYLGGEIDPTRMNPDDQVRGYFSPEVWAIIREKINLMTGPTEADKRLALHQDEWDAIDQSTDTKKYPDEDTKKDFKQQVDLAAFKELKAKNWMVGGYQAIKPVSKKDFGGSDFQSVVDSGYWEILWQKVVALNLSPEYREQLGITPLAKKKEELASTSDAAKIKSLESDIYLKSNKLYQFLRVNGFTIYEDITPAQKYATWLLVRKLSDQFGLNKKIDPEVTDVKDATLVNDVYEHPALNTKGVGEGQGNAEFIRSMTRVVEWLNILRNNKDAGVQAQIAVYLQILDKINNSISGDAQVLDFFTNFYANRDIIKNIYDTRPAQ